MRSVARGLIGVVGGIVLGGAILLAATVGLHKLGNLVWVHVFHHAHGLPFDDHYGPAAWAIGLGVCVVALGLVMISMMAQEWRWTNRIVEWCERRIPIKAVPLQQLIKRTQKADADRAKRFL